MQAKAYVSQIKTQNFTKVGAQMRHIILNKHVSCSCKFHGDRTIGGAISV